MHTTQYHVGCIIDGRWGRNLVKPYGDEGARVSEIKSMHHSNVEANCDYAACMHSILSATMLLYSLLVVLFACDHVVTRVLVFLQVLVLTEVAWEPRLDHTEYLVTWEVDGGGLKGNLFTDTTSVTLSLWPDTIYHIQVELASHADKSAPLTLDTHKALQVSFDITHTTESPVVPDFKPSRKIFESEKEVSLEEEVDVLKLNLQSPTRISSPLTSVVLKAESSAQLLNERQEAEMILGSVAAVMLFLVISALLVLRTRRAPVEFLLTGWSSRNPKLIPKERHCKPIVVVNESRDEKGSESQRLPRPGEIQV